MPITSCAPSSPRCKAPPCRCPTAAKRDRSWSISIPKYLRGSGCSAIDVVNAINVQNIILPSGTAKIGNREYSVQVNSSPDTVEGLNNLPLKQVNGAVIYIRDVAQVRDGFAVQANIVSAGNRRASLLTVLKSGGASTIDVVRRVKEILPKIQATYPGNWMSPRCSISRSSSKRPSMGWPGKRSSPPDSLR